AISGLVGASLTLTRDPGDRLPSIRGLQIRTRGLDVAGPSFHEDALDLAIEGDFSGKTGLARGRIEAIDQRSNGASRITADIGLLASLDALLGEEPARGLPLAGGVRMEIHDLPLDRLPFLEADALHGVLRGSAAIDVKGETGDALVAMSLLGGDQGRL